MTKAEFHDYLFRFYTDKSSSGHLPLVPANYFDDLDFIPLRLFCHFKARYLLPTQELVDFLKTELIGSRSAIEIGSGSGDLAQHLEIPATDNYCQTFPDVKRFYETIRQPTITYGQNVERIEALEAIDKYKPDVVIGAWVTQWIDKHEPPPPSGGSIHGIKEDELLKKVNKYIVIGAEETHGGKEILKYPHRKIAAPFVRSRRDDNYIWIWSGL